MNELNRRIQRGLPSAIVGASFADLPEPADVRVVRVACDVPRATLGPIYEMRRKIAQILGEPSTMDQARERVVSGLRRKLLGDTADETAGAEFVAICNRLSRVDTKPIAIVFDAVDAADTATLTVLRRIIERPGWLRPALIVSFRDEPSGESARLIEAIERSHTASVSRPPPKTKPEPLVEPPPLRSMPPEVKHVLRAGAIVGQGFEVEVVAALLGLDLFDVLEVLQRAADLGAPIEDRGEGRIFLPEPFAEELRRSTLPSLARAWHAALAELLAGEARAREAIPSPAITTSARASEPAIEEPARGSRPIVEPAIKPPIAPPPRMVIEPPAIAPPPAIEPPLKIEPPARVEAPPLKIEAPPNPRRAAKHHEAAGDLDASVARYTDAARDAERLGAIPDAIALTDKALMILATLPATDERRLAAAKLRTASGRLMLRGSSETSAFTIDAALGALERAAAMLRDTDPAAIRADIAALVAEACYDRGDDPSLDRALEELTRASRLLLDAGDPIGAARLLNDQAAVYVRMGDPVRAAHLLGESRHVFEERAHRDPTAKIELAETDHLLARIPLHVAARPGREDDALAAGLDHAIAAERAYDELGMRRERARVWETMGRIELERGKLDRAGRHLSKAVEEQGALGDLIGLARTTAALSSVLAATGRVEDALTLLGDSITLNTEKGSPIGLAFNRHALGVLERELGDGAPAKAVATARVIADRLAAAEGVLGKVTAAAAAMGIDASRSSQNKGNPRAS